MLTYFLEEHEPVESKIDFAPVGAHCRLQNCCTRRGPAKPPASDRKLRLVAIGGHGDDPQTCAGGTLALFADQGHDVVALSLTGGPPPPPEADPKVRAVRNRLDHIKADDILKIRLDCLNYTGGNMEQFRYGTACGVAPQRYKEFTEFFLDMYKPDIVFTHWPIDVHMDHRAASLLIPPGCTVARGFRSTTWKRSWEHRHKTLFPHITLISLPWSSARMRRGTRSRCGTTLCGLFMTECGRCEDLNAAARWQKLSTTIPKARLSPQLP